MAEQCGQNAGILMKACSPRLRFLVNGVSGLFCFAASWIRDKRCFQLCIGEG